MAFEHCERSLGINRRQLRQLKPGQATVATNLTFFVYYFSVDRMASHFQAVFRATGRRTFSTTAVNAARSGGRRRAQRKYDIDSMEKFNFDDQTSLGHDLFENIRTVRQYLRKTEFELPKLNCKLLLHEKL